MYCRCGICCNLAGITKDDLDLNTSSQAQGRSQVISNNGGVQGCFAAAKQAMARGDKAEAVLQLMHALELHEETKESIPRSTYFELGVLLYDLRRFEDAEAVLRKAIERQPKDFGLNNLLGVVLKNLRKYQEALRYLEVAQKAKPNDLSPLVNKGNIFLAQRDGAKAVETFSLIVRREPKKAEYQRLLGNAYRSLGDNDKALRQYQIARTLNPKDTNSWIDAASLLSLVTEAEEAIKVLDAGMNFAQDKTRLAETKVAILRRAGRNPEAIDFLQAELARDPNRGWIHAQLARCVMAVDRRKANEYWRAALLVEPENAQFMLDLADSLDRTRGPDEGANIEEGYLLVKRRMDLGASTIGEARILR